MPRCSVEYVASAMGTGGRLLMADPSQGVMNVHPQVGIYVV